MQRRALQACFDRESGHQLTGFGREMRMIPPSGGVLQASVLFLSLFFIVDSVSGPTDVTYAAD